MRFRKSELKKMSIMYNCMSLKRCIRMTNYRVLEIKNINNRILFLTKISNVFIMLYI